MEQGAEPPVCIPVSWDALVQVLSEYMELPALDEVESAYCFACHAHRGQTRRTGEPYVTHVLAVAHWLAVMRLDQDTVVAGLLHDVLEDTMTTKADLHHRFGAQVAELVDGVSKLDHIHFESRAHMQARNFRKMIWAIVKDVRVILIKLADRMHNMLTLSSLPASKQRRIARETLEIYAPIAHRLGMARAKADLEVLGFRALYPMRYRVLTAAMQRMHSRCRGAMGQILDLLRNKLEATGLEPVVSGREKRVYSMYQKMKAKRLSFSEINDMYAFRIITRNLDACYRALGVVHGMYKPIPGGFKDYIAIPKFNGYRSLHTVLFGPGGVPIEIQIRTHAMHRLSEHGIASHWAYKTSELSLSQAQHHARHWLSRLEAFQMWDHDPLEFLEHVKRDLFPSEVCVFTPKGDIIALPEGATAVDFAYAVHTDVGHRCVAVKIDKRFAPLSTRLYRGQTIEVITSPEGRPHVSWLSFVRSGKARGSIRHVLAHRKHEDAKRLGQRLLAAMMGGRSWDTLPDAFQERMLAEVNLSTAEQLWLALGLGQHMAGRVVQHLKACGSHPGEVEPLRVSVGISGTEGMVVQWARCCDPVPGDPIVGVLRAHDGLEVHIGYCARVAHRVVDGLQTIALHWETGVSGTFQVALDVSIANRSGTLAAITSLVADMQSDIEQLQTHMQAEGTMLLQLRLWVADRQHVMALIGRLKTLPSVLWVKRRGTDLPDAL